MIIYNLSYLFKFALVGIFFFALSCNNDMDKPSARKNNSIIESEKIKSSKLFWHWEDNFTTSEKTKIKKYITKVTKATFNILGTYPFDIHYYFHRSNSKSEPIPWAHTERKKNKQGVRFYINPELDEEILFSDWTAPHEISHLAIPFVGKENSWFAEGFASYMQYQIMQKMGIYTKEEINERYRKRIAKIQNDYSDKMNFVENAKALRARYNFPAMYWGGAMYFIFLNEKLVKEEGKTVNEIIKQYQTYRGKDKDIEMLLKSLDKDLKQPLFRELFEECNEKHFEEIYGKYFVDFLKIN